jgi:Histidine kinase
MIVNVALWLVGRSVRASLHYARGLESHLVTLERDRERREREAVAAERGRIARELHDVISHSVSLMVVQAGGGEVMFEREPRRALEALRSVQSTGRRAIEDLGRLLAVLREDAGGTDLDLSPVSTSSDTWRPGFATPDCQCSQNGGERRPCFPGPGRGGIPDRAGGPHERAEAR